MDQSGVDAVMAGLDEQPTPPPAEDVLELTESMTSPEPVPAFQTIDGQPDVVFTDAPPPPPGFEPAGIVVLEETMRPDAREVVAFFRAQGVDLKVISGDAPRTVEAVADTVVARVLDHMGVTHRLTVRWQEQVE